MGFSKIFAIDSTRTNSSQPLDTPYVIGINWNKLFLAVALTETTSRIYYDADSKADLDVIDVEMTLAEILDAADTANDDNGIIEVSLTKFKGIEHNTPQSALLNTEYVSYAYLKANVESGTIVHFDVQNRRYLNNKVLEVSQDLYARTSPYYSNN